jgi:Ca2+-binding EF-hand superfamily protein
VKRKETDESADDTDKEEEAESKETGDISAKSPNALETSMSDPTELRPAVRRLMTQVSVRSVKEVFNNDDIVDPNSELTKDEVNEKIMNVQEKGMVDKETFIADMISFFPNYNAESNKTKLGKLFDRLDDVSGSQSGFITSRQYMLVTIAFSNRNLADKLTKIFMLIDENGDEELTFEEFDDVVNDILVLKAEKKLSASMMKGRFSENMFRDMGVNTEGKINLRAFVDACTKHRFIIINYVENFREGFIIANDVGGEVGD